MIDLSETLVAGVAGAVGGGVAGWLAHEFLGKPIPKPDIQAVVDRLKIYDTYFNTPFVPVPVENYTIARWYGTIYIWKRMEAMRLVDPEIVIDINYDPQVNWYTIEFGRITSREVIVQLDGVEKFRYPDVSDKVGVVNPGYYIMIVQ